jgi:predicted small secreted protein
MTTICEESPLMKLHTLLAALVTVLALGMTGCAKEEGTMEKAGKSIDEAAEKVGDAAEEMKEEMKEAVEE